MAAQGGPPTGAAVVQLSRRKIDVHAQRDDPFSYGAAVVHQAPSALGVRAAEGYLESRLSVAELVGDCGITRHESCGLKREDARRCGVADSSRVGVRGGDRAGRDPARR